MDSTQCLENIIHKPFDTNLDEERSLGEYYFEHMNENSDIIAQIDSSNGQTETFGELLKRCISLAQALQNYGIQLEDIISICCYNNVDYVVPIIASAFLGIKFCGFDASTGNREVIHGLKLIQPKLLFCDEEKEDFLESCIKEAKINCKIIVFNRSNKCILMKDFVQKYKSDEEFKVNTSRTMRDSCSLAFTSGTSGLSKAAQLSSFGMYYSALIAIRTFPGSKRLMTSSLPYWISNLTHVAISIIGGIARVIVKNYNVETFVKLIFDNQVNKAIFTQFIINDLIKNPQCCQYDTSCLKYVYFGGSKIGINQVAKIQKLFPHTSFLNAFGMTEMEGLVFFCKEKLLIDENKNLSVGNPIPGIHYKIVDVNTEETLGPNKQGELRIKYKGIMNGYLHQPEVTAQAFDKDKYFKSGDICYYDKNYNFFVIDRLKEIFKFRDFHISPQYIEDTLIQLNDIKDCAVIPVPGYHEGELPMGVVVLKDNAKITKDEIMKHIKDNLSDIHQLRGGVKFVDSIPRTSTKKIRRSYLKSLILNEK